MIENKYKLIKKKVFNIKLLILKFFTNNNQFYIVYL